MLQSADSAAFDAPTIALDGGDSGEGEIGAFAPGLQAPSPAPPVVTAPAGAIEDETLEPAHPASDEIDARRARQLLDRALHLAERGEISGAVLACRQSIALAPAHVGGYSMLGMLLERANDIRGAILAYERVMELSPNSALERDSLARLRDKQDARAAGALFNFNEDELDGAKHTPPLPPVTKPASAAAPAAAPAAAERRGPDRRSVQIPVAVERRRSRDRREPRTPLVAGAKGSAPMAPTAGGAPMNAPGFGQPAASRPNSKLLSSPLMAAEMAGRRPTALQALMRNPSYYWKGAPLAACAVVGLVFLAWARGYALNNAAPPAVTPEPAVSASVTPEEAAPAAAATAQPVSTGSVTRPPGGPITPLTRPANGGGILAPSRPSVASIPSLPAAPPASRPRFVPLPPATVGQPASAPASVPVRASAPQPAPAARPGPSGDGGTGVGPLTPPRVPTAAPVEPPMSALPPDSPAGGSSANGSPLNSSGVPGRGYIRLSPIRVPASAPVRPSNAARGEESRAAAAARGGQPESAIASMTSAINNSDPNELGYRYQQRAMLFMERNDYGRAADDFQSAIGAYNDQIARGEQTAAARAGLRSARSGLNSALSARRN